MKRFITICVLLLASLVTFQSAVNATQTKQYETWNSLVDEMDILLNQSYDVYANQHDVNAAIKLVDKAYYGFYEKHGIERAVMSYISGKRGTNTEFQIGKIKRLMNQNESKRTIRKEIDVLLKMLHEDADELDGKKDSIWSNFFASLTIIVREGTEAILVIAAISAYLVRSGNKPMVKTVYASGLMAVLASIIAAIALHYVFDISGENGANKEIIEGVTMLLAVVVLFFVSNWMFAKAEAQAWKHYVEDKVKTAVAKGSSFALGSAAFLSVFREGAETILFYQGMLADAKENFEMVWLGLGVGCLILVVIFIIIRFGSMKIPLKPFFIGTSMLMYIMAIAFTGGGVKELQEAGIISATPVDYIQSIDILGIYPNVETLIPQAIMILFVVVSIVYYLTRKKQNK